VFRSAQKGVSGTLLCGCDSIVVSGLRKDGIGHDNFFGFMYAANSREGAKSILRSAHDHTPIRVFRSSAFTSPFRALSEDKDPAKYRFDGLYRVTNVSYLRQDAHGQRVRDLARHYNGNIPADRVYKFYLDRVEAGVGDKMNVYSNDQYATFCFSSDILCKCAYMELERLRIRMKQSTCTSRMRPPRDLADQDHEAATVLSQIRANSSSGSSLKFCELYSGSYSFLKKGNDSDFDDESTIADDNPTSKNEDQREISGKLINELQSSSQPPPWLQSIVNSFVFDNLLGKWDRPQILPTNRRVWSKRTAVIKEIHSLVPKSPLKDQKNFNERLIRSCAYGAKKSAIHARGTPIKTTQTPAEISSYNRFHKRLREKSQQPLKRACHNQQASLSFQSPVKRRSKTPSDTSIRKKKRVVMTVRAASTDSKVVQV
jgi:hypothetical protein